LEYSENDSDYSEDSDDYLTACESDNESISDLEIERLKNDDDDEYEYFDSNYYNYNNNNNNILIENCFELPNLNQLKEKAPPKKPQILFNKETQSDLSQIQLCNKETQSSSDLEKIQVKPYNKDLNDVKKQKSRLTTPNDSTKKIIKVQTKTGDILEGEKISRPYNKTHYYSRKNGKFNGSQESGIVRYLGPLLTKTNKPTRRNCLCCSSALGQYQYSINENDQMLIISYACMNCINLLNDKFNDGTLTMSDYAKRFLPEKQYKYPLFFKDNKLINRKDLNSSNKTFNYGVLLDEKATVRNKSNFMIPFLRHYASKKYLDSYDYLLEKEKERKKEE